MGRRKGPSKPATDNRWLVEWRVEGEKRKQTQRVRSENVALFVGEAAANTHGLAIVHAPNRQERWVCRGIEKDGKQVVEVTHDPGVQEEMFG